jgi:serine phosphatase RsbU (regulator of sigma subunit)
MILAEEALRKREPRRDRLRHSLEIAKEIQQLLLPKDNPRIDRLDVAGKSIYCDATGGDYFNFIEFKEKQKEKFSAGNIVLLATDGVWEARNKSGQMFDRTAVYDIIRNNSTAGAGEIMEAIISQIKKFLKASKPEDDLTLVVVKAL